MLHRFFISNYAIIDQITIEFDKGLSIITGETGAGKSILVEALELVLGGRTDSAAIKDATRKTIIEAAFSVNGKQPVFDWLRKNDLDEDAEIIVRRELLSTGKSRAFLNDTPVSLLQLKSLKKLLIDLHQQFDTLELTEADFQRESLDLLANCTELANTFHQQYLNYYKLKTELQSLKQEKERKEQEKEYHRFLLDELEAAHFQAEEIEKAESDLQLLEHAEGIAETISSGIWILNDSEQALLPQLKSFIQKMGAYANLHEQLQQYKERIQQAYTELYEISKELQKETTRFQPDQHRKKILEDRLDLGIKLLKKHRVKTTTELIHVQQELQRKQSDFSQLEEIISEKEQECSVMLSVLYNQASDLYQARKQATPALVREMNELLQKIGMPNARFDVAIEKLDQLHAFGNDSISFLYNGNMPAKDKPLPNTFQPIGKVASGGELSRVMLCLQSLIAQKTRTQKHPCAQAY